jgi:NAD-dependent deacetylase sirtuin 5
LELTKYQDYIEQNNFDDPFHPSLAITTADDARLAASSITASTTTMSTTAEASTIDPSTLPHCPSCNTGLLRPGVVWFGEALPEDTIREIKAYIDEGPIDLSKPNFAPFSFPMQISPNLLPSPSSFDIN